MQSPLNNKLGPTVAVELQSKLIDCWAQNSVPEFYQVLFLQFVKRLPADEGQITIQEEIRSMRKGNSYIQLFLKSMRQKGKLEEFLTPPAEPELGKLCQCISKLRELNYKAAYLLHKIRSKYEQSEKHSTERYFFHNFAVRLDNFRKELLKSQLGRLVIWNQQYDPFFMALKTHGNPTPEQAESLQFLFSLPVDDSYRFLKMKKVLLSWIYFDSTRKEKQKALPLLEEKYVAFPAIKKELIKERSIDLQKLKTIPVEDDDLVRKSKSRADSGDSFRVKDPNKTRYFRFTPAKDSPPLQSNPNQALLLSRSIQDTHFANIAVTPFQLPNRSERKSEDVGKIRRSRISQLTNNIGKNFKARFAESSERPIDRKTKLERMNTVSISSLNQTPSPSKNQEKLYSRQPSRPSGTLSKSLLVNIMISPVRALPKMDQKQGLFKQKDVTSSNITQKPGQPRRLAVHNFDLGENSEQIKSTVDVERKNGIESSNNHLQSLFQQSTIRDEPRVNSQQMTRNTYEPLTSTMGSVNPKKINDVIEVRQKNENFNKSSLNNAPLLKQYVPSKLKPLHQSTSKAPEQSNASIPQYVQTKLFQSSLRKSNQQNKVKLSQQSSAPHQQNAIKTSQQYAPPPKVSYQQSAIKPQQQLTKSSKAPQYKQLVTVAPQQSDSSKDRIQQFTTKQSYQPNAKQEPAMKVQQQLTASKNSQYQQPAMKAPLQPQLDGSAKKDSPQLALKTEPIRASPLIKSEQSVSKTSMQQQMQPQTQAQLQPKQPQQQPQQQQQQTQAQQLQLQQWQSQPQQQQNQVQIQPKQPQQQPQPQQQQTQAQQLQLQQRQLQQQQMQPQNPTQSQTQAQFQQKLPQQTQPQQQTQALLQSKQSQQQSLQQQQTQPQLQPKQPQQQSQQQQKIQAYQPQQQMQPQNPTQSQTQAQLQQKLAQQTQPQLQPQIQPQQQQQSKQAQQLQWQQSKPSNSTINNNPSSKTENNSMPSVASSNKHPINAKSSQVKEEKRQIKIKVGKMTYNALVQYLTAYTAHPQYSNAYDLKKVLKETEVQQTYLTEFLINDQPGALVLSSLVPPVNNFAIRLWLVHSTTDLTLSPLLFRKYIELVEKNITAPIIYFKGQQLPELENAGFQLKKDKLFARQRSSKPREIEREFEPFLSCECSNVSFPQKQKEDVLFSQEIQNFDSKNALAADFLFSMQSVPASLASLVKVSKEVKSFAQVNQLLNDEGMDLYEVNKSITASPINILRLVLKSLIKDPFTACEGVFKFFGYEVLSEPQKSIFFVNLSKHNGKLYFASGFQSIEQFNSNLPADSTKRGSVCVPMFTKNVYGRYQKFRENQRGFYGNWQLSLVWEDEMQGRVKHSTQSSVSLSCPFLVGIEVEGILLFSFEVRKDDLLY